ncbi:MAG: MFS transporter [Eubacteriales bacterium]|nr:MFS transporter [Eubacteriales bacterium]
MFLTGQTISLFGSSLVQYAIMWYITLQTQSGTMMTISIICSFVPTFLLSPFAGVWADRYDRKNLIVISDGAIALSTLILAMLFWAGYDYIWLLFATSAIRAFGAGVHTPAFNAFIPQIVPEEKLTRVNGLNGSIQSVVFLISPMVSGALLNFAEIEIIFLIDVFTAALGILTLVFFVYAKGKKGEDTAEKGYVSQMLSGIKYIKEHSFLKTFFIFFVFFSFFVSPVAFLTPLHITRVFGADVFYLTVAEIGFAAGMIVGGTIITAWGGFRNRVYTMTLSCVVTGIGTLILGINPQFWLYIGIMVVLGLVMPMFNTPCNVLIQEKVEDEYLGRVFGAVSMVSSSVMPIAMILFGPLADVVPIEYMLAVTGVILFIQSFYMIKSKTMRLAGLPQAGKGESLK